jgi:hypothetical protein
MASVASETIVQQLSWRYATKKFDPARKIRSNDLRTREQRPYCSPRGHSGSGCGSRGGPPPVSRASLFLGRLGPESQNATGVHPDTLV